MQACAVVAVVVLLSMAFRANTVVPVDARASLAPDFLLKETTVSMGTEVRFYGGGSTGSAPLTYAWHLRNGETADSPMAATTYELPGVYEVALVVQGGNGRMDLDRVTVTVREPLPGVDFPPMDAGPDRTAYEDEALTLSASAAWPPAYAASQSFAWDFGDGSTGSGASLSHAYGNAGTYHARATVTADFGAFDQDEVRITILNSPPVAAIGPRDVTVEEDESIVFDASGSRDTPSDGADLAFAWDFGDGSRGAGPIVSHAYPRRGTYVATLTATDDNGAQDSDSTHVTVINLPPTASAGPDLVVSEGDPAMFDGSGSEDTASDDPSLGYEWIRSPAVAPNPDPAISGWGATHTWFDDGAHDVVLRVTDDDGAEGLDLVRVTVSNVAPRATITGFWWFAEGILVEGRAFDPGADDLTFVWEQGGYARNEWSSPSSGDHPRRVTAYAFLPWSAAPPVSPITLRVLDGGGVGTDSIQVVAVKVAAPARPLCAVPPIIPPSCRLPPPDREMVDNLGPRVNAGLDLAAPEDLTMPFYAFFEDRDSQTVVDPDPPAIPVHPDPDHEYEWTFGDGSTASGNPVLHAFSRAGRYTVVVAVTDRAGDVASDGVLVAVANLDPVASFPVPTAAEDELVAVASVAQDTPSDAGKLAYEWTFSDGAVAVGASASHAFTNTGPAWIRLRVFDDDGESSEASAAFDIANVPPVAMPGGVQTVWEGQAVPLDGSASWDTATDRPRLSYAWSRDARPIAFGWSPVLEADGAGDFTVSLTVQDEHGIADTALFEIRVNAATPNVYAGLDRLVYGVVRDVELRGFASVPTAVLRATWAFGDGASADGLSARHAYRESGEYMACLSVSGAGPPAQDCLVVRVSVDSDGDNLLDETERVLGTDPEEFDTDHDGLTDDYEILLAMTDAGRADSDADGLDDWEELFLGEDGYVTDPWDPDTDGDGLSDYEESFTGYETRFHGTGGDVPDFAGGEAGVFDASVPGVRIHGPSNSWLTSSLILNLDHGRVSDLSISIRRGNGAWTPLVLPSQRSGTISFDTYDLRALGYTFAQFANLADWTVRILDNAPGQSGSALYIGLWVGQRTNPSNDDADSDDLTDSQELRGWPGRDTSDPWTADTDSDLLGDGAEFLGRTNPRLEDTDKDGLSDHEEVAGYGSSPVNGDHDGDGLMDGDEISLLGVGDLDADGTANLFDLDSDGDQIHDGVDVNPGIYNGGAHGEPRTWDALGVHLKLGVTVGVDYASSGPRPVIEELRTPSAPLPGHVGPYLRITAGSGVVSGEIRVLVTELQVPEGRTYYRLMLYRYAVGAGWRVVPDSGSNAADGYVWGQVPGFSEFAIAPADGADSDGDGLTDDVETGTPSAVRRSAGILSGTEIHAGDSLLVTKLQGTTPVRTVAVPPEDVTWITADLARGDSDLFALGFTDADLEGGFTWRLANTAGEALLQVDGFSLAAWRVISGRFMWEFTRDLFLGLDLYRMHLDAQGLTDPHVADTDGDLWSDGTEVTTWQTMPLHADSDLDGWTDPYDMNPWVDLTVTVRLGTARGLDATDWWCERHDFMAAIEIMGNPDDFDMPDPGNCHDVNPENLNFQGTSDVSDGMGILPIRIWLWDDDDLIDDQQDINPIDVSYNKELVLDFDLATGEWSFEDEGDQCAWGNVNGEEDGTWGSDNNDQDASLDFIVYMNDADGDCLTYREEVLVHHTNPLDGDSDDDTMTDHYEVLNGLNPLADDATADADRDGLTNIVEFQIGTRAGWQDTDNDGIGDGYEYVSGRLDPLFAGDGPSYALEIHRFMASSWHTLRRVGGLADYDRLAARYDNFGASAQDFLRDMLVPDPSELPKDILEGIVEDVSEDISGLPGAAISLGRAIFFYNSVVVMTTLYNWWRGDCAGTNLPQEPGYVYLLAWGLECDPSFAEIVATLDSDGNPIGGIAFDLKENDEESWLDQSRYYYVHGLSVAARTRILPRWGTYASPSGGVTLPARDDTGNEVLTFYPFTGYPLEDSALGFGARLWAAWGNDYECVGQTRAFIIICPQLGDNYVTVHDVVLSLIQVALQGYQSLVLARTFLEGIVRIDPQP